MSYLVFGLGLLLAICGAASISFGYGIINVERGWASVIGGAAALSGGIITIALATILHSLSGLRALLRADRIAGADALDRAAAPRASDESRQLAVSANPEGVPVEPPAASAAAPESAAPPVAAFPDAPAAQASIEDIRRIVAETIKRPPQRQIEIDAPAPAPLGEPGLPQAPPDAPPLERAPRRPEPFGLPRALDLKDIAPQHFGAAHRERQAAVAAGRASPPETELAPLRPAVEPAAPPRTRPPPAPARPPIESAPGAPPPRGDEKFGVIGRYESEGTTYVMFADGSIDARSDLGAFHFASMAELKAFMDAQPRGQR